MSETKPTKTTPEDWNLSYRGGLHRKITRQHKHIQLLGKFWKKSEMLFAKLEKEIADCVGRSNMSRENSIARLCEYYQFKASEGNPEEEVCFQLLYHCFEEA